MDRILFGDNQFFGINHLSEDKALQQSMRFRDLDAIMEVLDYVYQIGLRTFMCTTHERIAEVCDRIRANAEFYKGFQFYPCMPYAHKYNNAMAEYGMAAALRRLLRGRIVSTVARGGVAIVQRDYVSLMRLLVDTEMGAFEGVPTGAIFLQNVVTDLLLGMGMTGLLAEFAEYVADRYHATPGFITMNLPALSRALESGGVGSAVICSSINKIGFRMPGGTRAYEESIARTKYQVIAMQPLAAGALSPRQAVEYVCAQPGISSILFGASTRAHIAETKSIIESLSAEARA